MEFLTLHELSVQLDVSVRVLRHRLRQLLLAGKLIENADCRRDDFVDDTHFVWRVDPVAFMRATGLRLVNPPDNSAQPAATQAANQPPTPANQLGNRGEQTLPKVDTTFPSMEREMIDLLKGQLGAKDGQISDLSGQNMKLNDVNLKLVAQTVQQSDRIQTLMRLTEGKMELADMVAQTGNGTATTDSSSGDRAADTGNDFGNHPSSLTRDWGRDLAA